MTTLELYRKHRKGEVSKERFLYEVRRDARLPWVTNVTSYNDAVKILKNKGIISELAVTPENTNTAPEVDRVNPYFLKKGVEKMLKDDPALVNGSYIDVLNKAAKKLAKDPHAFDDDLISNATSAHKLDQDLQMRPVKKASDHVDEENAMEKVKGQETLKAQSAPTGENKKGKPEGVKVMKDKGVTGSEKVIKEITDYLKKKLAISENSVYHEYAVGQSVPTQHGECIIKEINGGTLTVEAKDGKLYDVQMNAVSDAKKKKHEEAEKATHEEPMKEEEYTDFEDETGEFDDFDAIDYDDEESQQQDEYFINVAVRDARAAQELFRDLSGYREFVQMDGSDAYVISDLDAAQDILSHFIENGIEIVDTDVPADHELDEDRLSEEDVELAKINKDLDNKEKELGTLTTKKGQIMSKPGTQV